MGRWAVFALTLFLPLFAEIRNHPGGKELPHDQYIRVVSETDSPVEQRYIKSKDGLYVAAALRKPKGNGPFPALLYFHGAPGGRGMEQLVGWSRGATGGPVWERFLQEGYVVVVADYRHPVGLGLGDALPKGLATYTDDAVAVLDFVKKQPYVNPDRISAYGVSLGGSVVLHLINRVKLHAAVLGAPAPMAFLGVKGTASGPNVKPEDRFKGMTIDEELTRANIEPIQTPVLILVGTADALINVDRPLHDRLVKYGKNARMEIYENGYHDFCVGPQGHVGRKEPLLDATLDALEKTVAFVRNPSN